MIDKIAKNLLLEQTCDNCVFSSTMMLSPVEEDLGLWFCYYSEAEPKNLKCRKWKDKPQ